MAQGHDQRDRSGTGEETTEGNAAESGTAPAAATADGEESVAETRPELGRARLLEPRHALEIGRNGRFVASHYHEGRDTWEVLLETYDDE